MDFVGKAQEHCDSLPALDASQWMLNRVDSFECAFWYKGSEHEARGNSKPGIRTRLSFGSTQKERLFDSQPLSHSPVFSLSHEGNLKHQDVTRPFDSQLSLLSNLQTQPPLQEH